MEQKSGGHVEPFVKLARTSTPIIQAKINRLKRLNLDSATISEVVPMFSDLLSYQFRMLMGVYYPWYYRARITTLPNIKELINPPIDSVSTFGRCNDIHQSVFYCSNCYVTSILEVKPNLGDIVTVLILDLTKEGDDGTRHLPLIPLAKDSLNEDLLSGFISSGNKNVNERLRILDQFYNEIMLQEVPVGEEWRYKLSASLTKALTDRHPNFPCAVAFPSRASKHFGVNFAIPSKWIASLYKPRYKAFRVQIVKLDNSFSGEGHIIDVAKTTDSEGNFIFTDVSHIQRVIPLNSFFYQQYEAAFKEQKMKLKSQDGFFRRYYPPPYFAPPHDLNDNGKYLSLDDLRKCTDLYEFTVRTYELEYEGIATQNNLSPKPRNPWQT